jgi:hypothetical protein
MYTLHHTIVCMLVEMLMSCLHCDNTLFAMQQSVTLLQCYCVAVQQHNVALQQTPLHCNNTHTCKVTPQLFKSCCSATTFVTSSNVVHLTLTRYASRRLARNPESSDATALVKPMPSLQPAQILEACVSASLHADVAASLLVYALVCVCICMVCMCRLACLRPCMRTWLCLCSCMHRVCVCICKWHIYIYIYIYIYQNYCYSTRAHTQTHQEGIPTQPHTHTHKHTHTHTYQQGEPINRILPHTHTHTYTHKQKTHSHTHPHTHPQIKTHTHTHPQIKTHTHTRTKKTYL